MQIKLFHAFFNIGNISVYNIIFCITQFVKEFFSGFIAFRMYRCIIKHVVTVRYSQKSGALLKSFISKLRNLEQLAPRLKTSVFFTVNSYILCYSFVYSRYI